MEIKYFDTYETILQEFGRRLKEERLSQNKKREDLSEQTGISVSTIERMERGEDVKFSSIIRLLQGLDLVENLNIVIQEDHIDLEKLFKQEPKRKRARTKKQNNEKWIWEEDK